MWEFEHLLFVDVDIFLVHPPTLWACVAACPRDAPLCATSEGYFNTQRHAGYFNSGFMLLRPRPADHASLVRAAHAAQGTPGSCLTTLPDQDAINAHFRNASSVVLLPRACNEQSPDGLADGALIHGKLHVLDRFLPMDHWARNLKLGR